MDVPPEKRGGNTTPNHEEQKGSYIIITLPI
jgi:hypothetical protein